MLAQSAQLYFGPWYRKSPFFEATRRYGCTGYDIYNHTYLPAYYDEPNVEYWALVRDVTIWDVGCERIVELSGPDVSEFIDTLTCRDLSKCAVGQCKYMPVIAQDGGIVNDPVLLRVEPQRWWMALADSDAGLFALGVAAHAGKRVSISHPPVYPIQVQGPRSKETLQRLFGDEILGLKYYHCREADLDGIPVVVSRTGWTAVVGYEIYLRDPSRGDDLWERVMEAGKPFGIRPIAPSEARRIEAGIFNYGSDFGLENNPFEIMGMERLVEPKDAFYLGRAALERIRREGVKRRLVGIEIEARELRAECAEYWPARQDGRRIGHVTDAVWSPGLEKNIGYVWVPTELSQPGTRLEVEMPSGVAPARTAAIPFVDPTKRRPLH
jgi:aminomethyltransferase